MATKFLAQDWSCQKNGHQKWIVPKMDRSKTLHTMVFAVPSLNGAAEFPLTQRTALEFTLMNEKKEQPTSNNRLCGKTTHCYLRRGMAKQPIVPKHFTQWFLLFHPSMVLLNFHWPKEQHWNPHWWMKKKQPTSNNCLCSKTTHCYLRRGMAKQPIDILRRGKQEGDTDHPFFIQNGSSVSPAPLLRIHQQHLQHCASMEDKAISAEELRTIERRKKEQQQEGDKGWHNNWLRQRHTKWSSWTIDEQLQYTTRIREGRDNWCQIWRF